MISTPHTNGKRWWTETWGKAIGSVMAGLLLAAIWWTWGVVIAFHAATVEVYSLPPMVSAHEKRLQAIEARPPMPQADVDKLAAAIAAAMAKKGKP